MTDDDKELGDPKVPRPGDPDHILLRLDTRALQAVVAGLSELPAKISRATLNNIEQQVQDAVLMTRRAARAAKTEADKERLAAAEARRQRRDARHARANGTPETPPEPPAA